MCPGMLNLKIAQPFPSSSNFPSRRNENYQVLVCSDGWVFWKSVQGYLRAPWE